MKGKSLEVYTFWVHAYYTHGVFCLTNVYINIAYLYGIYLSIMYESGRAQLSYKTLRYATVILTLINLTLAPTTDILSISYKISLKCQ